MKFIPQGVARAAAKQALKARKNSPTLLFSAGVVGSVASTVLACRATLKLEETLEKTHNDLERAHEAVGKELKDGSIYTEQDTKRDIALIYIRGAVDVAKLYAPAILLGALSLAALTKSHHILKERNLALASAYTAVDEAFKKYRSRVIEKYGIEEDQELRFATEEIVVIDDETGLEVTRIQPDLNAGGSMYARWFDETSTVFQREGEYNYALLAFNQNHFNDMLKAKGYVFLNDVYKALGLKPSPAGQIVGWFSDGEGDSYIDFGVGHVRENATTADDYFSNGRPGAILLDFNVDGPIYNKLDKVGS